MCCRVELGVFAGGDDARSWLKHEVMTVAEPPPPVRRPVRTRNDVAGSVDPRQIFAITDRHHSMRALGLEICYPGHTNVRWRCGALRRLRLLTLATHPRGYGASIKRIRGIGWL